MANVIRFFQTKPLYNSEYLTFMQETDLQVTNAGEVKAGLEGLYPVFSGDLTKLQQTYIVSAGNPLTLAKDKAEHFRDNRYAAFSAVVNNALYDSNPDISNAAETIQDVLNETGNPTSLGDSIETAQLFSLLTRLEPFAQQINLIGGSQRLNELDAANKEFVRIQDEWYDVGGQKPSGNMYALRRPTDTTYRSIVNRINALVEINGPERYKAFIDSHNKTIEQYRNIVAQRKGRQKSEAEKKKNADTPQE
jgi:hypothetical protein